VNFGVCAPLRSVCPDAETKTNEVSIVRTEGVLAIGILAGVASLHAAEPGRDLATLSRLSGQLVYVQDRSGQETLARVLRSNDSELVVTVAGIEHVITVGRIAKVFIRGDSLRNGAWWGGGLGFVNGVLSTQGLSCSDCAGRATAQVLLSTGVGLAIGVWIDARHAGRTEVYRHP
jgi:hypothetical protein